VFLADLPAGTQVTKSETSLHGLRERGKTAMTTFGSQLSPGDPSRGRWGM